MKSAVWFVKFIIFCSNTTMNYSHCCAFVIYSVLSVFIPCIILKAIKIPITTNTTSPMAYFSYFSVLFSP